MRNTVVLTGMMGSGKTTLGKELAKNLKIDFFDAVIQCVLVDGFYFIRREDLMPS